MTIAIVILVIVALVHLASAYSAGESARKQGQNVFLYAFAGFLPFLGWVLPAMLGLSSAKKNKNETEFTVVWKYKYGAWGYLLIPFSFFAVLVLLINLINPFMFGKGYSIPSFTDALILWVLPPVVLVVNYCILNTRYPALKCPNCGAINEDVQSGDSMIFCYECGIEIR